jgi:hypothetical protein
MRGWVESLRSAFPVPETCPNCGADVPPNELSCPDCGADESTGWNERAKSQNLGLPDDEFDHDQFVKEEFGAKRDSAAKTTGVSWFWWVVALLVAGGFAVVLLR